MTPNRKTDKQALQEWDEFLLSIRNSTPVDLSETEEEKAERIKRLEAPGNHEEWFKYYFPKYSFCEPADFHKKSSKKFLSANRLYHRRAWARGLSKTTRRMFEILYKTLAKKFQTNMLLISKSWENAARLLDSYQANLEANQRIINDYGVQERAGKWERGEFTTRNGCTFRAVGAEQNPRGAKNEEIRVSVIVFDDADDDEVCRNPERLQNRWDWAEQAVMPTVDISKDYFICWDNNIIAEDSLAVRAAAYADYVETVNIRDENGKSVWPEKNSEEDIDYMESKLSYESAQKEYYNNPMNAGKTFKEIIWGKCPPLKKLPFVVVYADPATSNKDKPTAKSKAQNSAKCVAIIGHFENRFYIYNCYLDNTSNSNFIDWFYASRAYIADKTQPYFFIENNTLQDPFYSQVLLPLIFDKGKVDKPVLPITPDTRDKPDKWFRVEGTLEPLNRLGLLIFNEQEKSNPHMLRLEAQFKAASATSKRLDGPDCIEGGIHIIKNKISIESAGGIHMVRHKPNPKRL
jgi:hypothetical protein